jgi:hypothetical protein
MPIYYTNAVLIRFCRSAARNAEAPGEEAPHHQKDDQGVRHPAGTFYCVRRAAKPSHRTRDAPRAKLHGLWMFGKRAWLPAWRSDYLGGKARANRKWRRFRWPCFKTGCLRLLSQFGAISAMIEAMGRPERG